MGPNVRYHVASMIAVLSAVVVGVIVGVSLTQPDKLEARMQALRKDFQRVIQQSRQVSKEAEGARQQTEGVRAQLEQVARSAMYKRLEGRRIAIIHTGGVPRFDDLETSLRNALRIAGAEAASATQLDRDKLVGNPAVLDKVAQAMNWPEGPTSHLQDFRQTLSNVFSLGDESNAMQILAKAGLIRIASDYATPVDSVIIVGGGTIDNAKSVEALDLPLIKALTAAKLNVVGCEPEKISVSVVSEYARAKISTVDNVDTIVGQAALVLALAGHRGHFGVKDSATALLPSLGS